MRYYEVDYPVKRKVPPLKLMSFLLYSRSHLPLPYTINDAQSNNTTIIPLIIRDEAVHGYYIGYKYQKAVEQLSAERQAELKDYTFSLLLELYENEEHYTEDIYDPVGWTEDVKVFLRYNANKALMNLG